MRGRINRCNTRPPTNSGPGCSHPIQWAAFVDTAYMCPGEDKTATAQLWGQINFTVPFGVLSPRGLSTGNPLIGRDLITLSRVPGPARPDWKAWVGGGLYCGALYRVSCNPVRLKFSTKGKRFLSWEAGQSWGLRLYQSGMIMDYYSLLG